MRITSSKWFAILSCLTTIALAACGSSAIHHASFLAMGTRVDITIEDSDDRRAAATIAAIEHKMLNWSSDWYAWGDGNGELERLNTAIANGQTFNASPELFELINKSKQLSIVSEGYFDPAVAPMIKAWGIQNPDHPPSQLPNVNQLHRWTQSHLSVRDIELSGTQIRAPREIQIDLGAIAKGYALDLINANLKQTGIRNAIVNLGGQIMLMGDIAHGDRQIRIRDPRLTQALTEIGLEDGDCISTSGDYERFFVKDGHRVHHILDPYTGSPVMQTQMVVVIEKTCTVADAASTAIMAAGIHWREIAERLHISQLLRVDVTGEIELTAAMYARVKGRYTTLHTHKLVIIN